ncbi:MAG: efflux RND transporter permease subunit [Bacteroidales bacterium]|nr:efflux RND transporter permease subunit [Bacteroidales bacterium]MDD4617759.1 efflux RND transporter permease subunit [Bacteroidales bacterium]
MRLPSFSVILVFVVLVVVGAGVAPLLSLQYKPTEKGSNLSVSFSWSGASARVIEAEVTSKLEGIVSTLKGVREVSSTSSKNSGFVNVSFKPGTDMDAVRFELSSVLRRIYPKLPEGVSFPSISSATGSYSEDENSPVLVYTINSSLSSIKIKEYTEDKIVKELSLIPGLRDARMSGFTSYVYEIEYNTEYIGNLGISASDISSAINTNNGRETILGNREGKAIVVRSNAGDLDLEQVPVKNVNGRIVRIGDIANVELKEEKPQRYSRINGLNTINLYIIPEKGVNNLELIASVKSTMQQLSHNFPADFSAFVVEDQSKEIKGEIDKILRRTILSLLILLAFVFAVSRSLRYLAIISVTLLANILIAFIFYYIFNLEIHIYSLAGITVSLGIVIDTSIIMISHYGYYKDRKAFIAILAALLTTIGALTVVFLLPDQEKNMLMEFAAVIIVNLMVSMAIALLFIPALIDKFPIKGVSNAQSISRARKIVKFNGRYQKFIVFGRRYKWVFVLIIILGFGLPVHKLPAKLDEKEGGSFNEIYNKTIGSNFYQNKLKKHVEPLLGGTLRLFEKGTGLSGGFYRDPARPELSIGASMPDGCTVEQLNEIVKFMENYLSQFPQIEMFYTNISSYSNASIRVRFLKEVENTGFPLMLKNEVISKAIDFGGANWRVTGIDDQYFNNNVGSMGGGNNRIELTGYNYDMLYGYGMESAQSLLTNQRVKEPYISGASYWGSRGGRNEYFIDFDKERMAMLDIDPALVYGALNRKLSSSGSAMVKMEGEEYVRANVLSDEKGTFDIWNLRNEYLDLGGRKVKFSDIGNIDMRKSGNDIFKRNQQYLLNVAYDFIGSYELARRVMEREIDRLNKEVLPVGFKAGVQRHSWDFSTQKTFFLLFVIVAIIYLICAILFESLLQPLTILLLIPFSFIGLFLTFYLTGYRFDQGGFAALIMLSGISVNAGIYVLNQYNIMAEDAGKGMDNVKLYIKAYNHKIIPIVLTVVSTVLGLTPFLTDGPNEVFWFSFAVGTMGGLVFSILGIVLFMPVLFSRK